MSGISSALMGINIYTLSDLGDFSNLIGSLSRTIQQYSPPSEWIMSKKCDPKKIVFDSGRDTSQETSLYPSCNDLSVIIQAQVKEALIVLENTPATPKEASVRLPSSRYVKGTIFPSVTIKGPKISEAMKR